jgi:hypothetical protein
MRARIPALLLATLSIAGALVGCGGDDSAPASAGLPYLEANRICTEVANRFEKVQVDSPRSFEQGAELLSVLSDAADAGERALSEIDVPPLQAIAFERYLKARKRVGDLLEKGLQAARDEEGKTYEHVRLAANAAAAERRRLAKYAGLRECAAAERG